MNKAFKKYGKKKYHQTGLYVEWFTSQLQRNVAKTFKFEFGADEVVREASKVISEVYSKSNASSTRNDVMEALAMGDASEAFRRMSKVAEEAKSSFVNFSVAAGEIYLENCDSIDRLLDFPVAQRDVYGSDKNSKPNDHCRWDDYHMYWIETDKHFADRIMKGEFKLPSDIREIEIKGKII